MKPATTWRVFGILFAPAWPVSTITAAVAGIVSQVASAAVEGARPGNRLPWAARCRAPPPAYRPYKVWFQDGTIYVVAHCHLRNAMRTFVVDRISLLQPTDERFTVPETFRFEDDVRHSFKVMTDEPFSGGTPHAAGNGPIMRLAPVPLFFAGDPQAAIEMAGESSRTTHGLTVCVDACRYLAGILVGAVNGASRDEILSSRYSPVPGYWDRRPLCPEIDGIAAGSFKERQPPWIKGAGYVVRSLEAALWAFHRNSDFRSGTLEAVNLGDDADTTGAVYGQIAGASYGAGGIPADWLDLLCMRGLIENLALRIQDHGAGEKNAG